MRSPENERPNATRARRALLLALGLYLSAQIAVGFALDHAPLRVRFAQAAGILRKAADLARPPDVVILGSSRFRASVRTWVMDEALRAGGGEAPPVLLNAAVEAGDPLAMDLMLERLLAASVRPRLVLIEISPETLARRSGWMNAHIARQLTFTTAVTILPQIALSRRLDDLLSARLNPVHVYRKEILIWITGRKPPFLRVPAPAEAARARSAARDDDVLRANLDESEEEIAAAETRHRAGRGARRIRRWLRGYVIAGFAPESLDRLLERCRTHGIEAILVAPPVAGIHRAQYTPAIDAAFSAYMTDLTARHQVRFLDYRERLPDDLFVDNHHTTERGAHIWSRMLAEEVLRPAWSRGVRPRRGAPGAERSRHEATGRIGLSFPAGSVRVSAEARLRPAKSLALVAQPDRAPVS